MKSTFIIASFFFNCIVAAAQQQDNSAVKEGNQQYRKEQYDEAATSYKKAVNQNDKNTTAKYNLGNALIKQKKYNEADTGLAALDVPENKPALRSKAAYNRGVAFTQQKKLEASIESYKQALRLNPNDQEARENLQKALLELKKKQPKKEEEKKKDQEQNQKQQPKPKISQKQAQEQLKLLEQKEKDLQNRLQKNSKQTGNAQEKDW